MVDFKMNEIRKSFLSFFESKDHNRLKSFSLVPQNDDSLLLINAGMAPLKDYFTGLKKMEPSRATSSQRCVRTQDLDNVGKTDRHGTYFEMLGNFSFGDYFKREAIHWGYEFLTEWMGLDSSRFYVTVYLDDDEAYDIWTKEVGIPESRMLRLGKEDNFWELEQGPCGPCSEIHYDRGEKYGPGTGPVDNSDRFMEIWNLVFTQFDKQADGQYLPLANPNIDTGMGLERIACVMEDVDNIFDLSIFRPIRDEIERIAGKTYGSSDKDDVSIRVILDHAKAMTFMVSDGIVPSNEGRGYVLRRLIRRAARHGKLLGIREKFLTSIVDKVIQVYRTEYDELVDGQDRIKRIIAREEDNFEKTIDSGLNLLEGLLGRLKEEGKDLLDGDSAFKLYDTYGFPLDLTREIVEERGIRIDEDRFAELMNRQRTQSRESRQGSTGWTESAQLDLDGLEATEFSGYDRMEDRAEIRACFLEGKREDRLDKGQEGIIVLDRTPFYGEGGGQVGDRGRLTAEKAELVVNNTTKNSQGIYFHQVTVLEGTVEVGDQLTAEVDEDRRNDIRRNHSATHLLHTALKRVLGNHINQAGSYVDAERLRFDFSHFEAMSQEEIRRVEEIVNRAIFDSYPVQAAEMSLEEATAEGAIGLFEDKYGDRVRVISMGDFSKELCGGTHIDNTAQVQSFRILSEQGISSGVRRIEALTGRNADRQYREFEDRLDEIAASLKTGRAQIQQRLTALLEEDRELRKQLASYQAKLADEMAEDLSGDLETVKGVAVIAKEVKNQSMDELKELFDHMKEDRSNYVIVLASHKEDKVSLIAGVDEALTKRGLHAGKIIKEVAQAVGGNGGGRPNFATAGGKDPSKIADALALVPEWIDHNIN